jgi:hypothetical protein
MLRGFEYSEIVTETRQIPEYYIAVTERPVANSEALGKTS